MPGAQVTVFCAADGEGGFSSQTPFGISADTVRENKKPDACLFIPCLIPQRICGLSHSLKPISEYVNKSLPFVFVL